MSDVYAAGDICGLDGSYQVVQLISKGGMGEVYRVTHRQSGRQFALKRLQFRHTQNGMFLDKIKAEAAAGQEMRHPNLCPVYESALDEQGGYFVMEYLEGETVADRVRRGPVPPVEALEIGAQVADGLYALHMAKIFHRDVKPANIFLTRDGRVLLLDLGAAKFERYGLNTTQSAPPLGTVLYMSPEHAHNRPLDGRADVWALGHVMYTMLTGAHALEAHGDRLKTANAMNIVMMLANEDVPPLTETAPHLPRLLWDIVRVATHRDRERRFDSASSFAATMRGAAKVLRGEAELSTQRAPAIQQPSPAPTASTPTPTPHVSPEPSAVQRSSPHTPGLAPGKVGPKGTEMMMSAPERFDAPSAVPPRAPVSPPAPEPMRAPSPSAPPAAVHWGSPPAPSAPPARPAPPAGAHAPAPRAAHPSPPSDQAPYKPLFPEDFTYRRPGKLATRAPAQPSMSTANKIGIVIVAMIALAALAVIAYIILKSQRVI